MMIDTNYYYCQQKLTSGTSLYYSFYFANAAYKTPLLATHAFFREVSEIVTECRDQGVARTKLAWWQEEVERLYEHQARHPVTKLLTPFITQQDIPAALLQSIITTVANTVGGINLPSYAKLELHCHNLYSAAFMLQAQSCGVHDKTWLTWQRDCGLFCKMVSMIRYLYRDIKNDNLYIPAEWCALYQVDCYRLNDAAQQQNLQRLLHFVSEQAMQRYQQLEQQVATTKLPQALLTSYILLNLQERILRQLVRNNFSHLQTSTSLTPIGKLWRAWRIARRIAP